jgi:hypothetical protein
MLVSQLRPTRFSDRGAENDVAQAEAAIERLAAAPADREHQLAQSHILGAALEHLLQLFQVLG